MSHINFGRLQPLPPLRVGTPFPRNFIKFNFFVFILCCHKNTKLTREMKLFIFLIEYLHFFQENREFLRKSGRLEVHLFFVDNFRVDTFWGITDDDL